MSGANPADGVVAAPLPCVASATRVAPVGGLPLAARSALLAASASLARLALLALVAPVVLATPRLAAQDAPRTNETAGAATATATAKPSANGGDDVSVDHVLRDLGDGGDATRRAMLDRLAALGPALDAAVVCSLIDGLRTVTENDTVRVRALVAGLAEAAPFAGEDAREDLTKVLADRVVLIHKDPIGFVRLYCRLQIEPSSSDDHLLELLADAVPYRREFAAQLLGRRGPAASAVALPALKRARNGEGEGEYSVSGPGWSHSSSGGTAQDARDQAALAIARIAPDDPASIAGHVRLLAHPFAAERLAAVRALGGFGADAAEAVDALRARLKDPDARVAREAITALGMIGPAAHAAAADLEELESSADKQVAARARAALRQIGG